MVFDADRRQGPAIAVGALTQDFNAPPMQEVGEPGLRLKREIGFIGALPLDLGGIDIEDPNRFRLPRCAQADVLVLHDGSVAGYYTLSSTAVRLPELPAAAVRKLPRYPLIPATLLGRLAVDQRFQGKGYGRFLLADALHRAVRSEIASFAVIVDAKDESARRFYERESFLPLPDQPMKLFRPMSDIEALFR